MTNSKVYVAPYERYRLAVQGASKATATAESFQKLTDAFKILGHQKNIGQF